jgi:hypothetical protein
MQILGNLKNNAKSKHQAKISLLFLATAAMLEELALGSRGLVNWNPGIGGFSHSIPAG